MARVAVRHVSEVFDSQVVVLLPGADGRIRHPRGESISGSLHGADLALAQWVQDHGRQAGLGTDTLPGAEMLYLPLKGSQAMLGVLAVLPANARRVLLPEQFHLLETFAGQVALALERAQLAEQAHQREHRRRDRGPAQRAARLDLARPAHAAGGHLRRLVEPRRARRAARSPTSAARSRAASSSSRSRWPSSSPTCCR